MTRIKICGLTNEEDVRAAVAFGADALGFIAVEQSPRFVASEQVRQITRALPPFITKVVVAKQPIDAVVYPCDVIQCYGGETEADRGRHIRVFRIKDEMSLLEIQEYRRPVTAFLLDTYHDGALGGIGKTFNWSLAIEAKRIAGNIPIILAGGLTPDNVADAVRIVRPYAVDVSSGVEAEPGRKDHGKLAQFIAAIRQADLLAEQ